MKDKKIRTGQVVKGVGGKSGRGLGAIQITIISIFVIYGRVILFFLGKIFSIAPLPLENSVNST